MTLEEAMDYIKCALDAGCTQVCNCKYRGECTDEKIAEALTTMIDAMKELEEYRNLGTIEEIEQAYYDLYG